MQVIDAGFEGSHLLPCHCQHSIVVVILPRTCFLYICAAHKLSLQELGFSVISADLELGECFDITTSAGFVTLGRTMNSVHW